MRRFRLCFCSCSVPPLCHFRSENLHSVRSYPKKVEKTSSENITFEIRSTPIALAALPVDLSSFLIFQCSIKNLSFRCGLSQKSRKNVNRKHHFVVLCSETHHSVRSCPKKVEKTSSENTVPPLCQFSYLKPIIPLRAVPKKSKNTCSKNTTLSFFVLKPIIPLRAVPKKSEKNVK